MITKRISFLLLLASCLLISFPSIASVIPIAVKGKTTAGYSHDSDDSKERNYLLGEIEIILNSMNTEIPNPTPNEITWIATEQHEIEQVENEALSQNRYEEINKRNGALYNRRGTLCTSVPYKKQEIKELLNTGLSLVKQIKQTTNVNKKMIYWTQLAAVIIDRATLNESLDALEKTIKDPEYFRQYYDAALLDVDGRKILSRIIIPYIKESSRH